MWVTTVKGHATQEMVAEGKVEEEEKKGNDESDKAAGMGSTKSQGRIAKSADLYIAGDIRSIRSLWQGCRS